ncbi:phage Gp37/Gp68 family protein [Novosphingobium sp. ST904]|uniref:DUF5131 family protein n=1 Tax=Novosphingobium sp. ST904 TaxID=1684385 RepID=UPI0006C873A4|nr:phage Gp37/Gp68 family protein [Novosphingobium sp. ST904]KPH59166.1 hypothetical protein ADT71_23770 [Novosphingobium sp. ST904]TCM37751.1 protein gp37 [Novosphingobium sp. ST904]
MADGSKIEWTEATWNPITGCSLASPGCTNCYAMKLAGTRMKNHASRKGLTIDTKAGPVWNGDVRLNEQWLDLPLRWKRPRMIFVCAHGDLFHESVPDEWIDRVFAVMALARQHTFQVLTKRSARMREYVNGMLRGRSLHDAMRKVTGSDKAQLIYTCDRALPNVWLGVSVEDQARADERIGDLLKTPAAKRWLSCEPLLGPIDLSRWTQATAHCPACGFHTDHPRALRGCKGYCQDPSGNSCDALPCPKCARLHYWTGGRVRLDWVVVGGESGKGARPMHPDWARSLRDQCREAKIPFFFKQWGDWDWLYSQDGDCWRPYEFAVQQGYDSATWQARPRLIGKACAGRLLEGIEWSETPL